MGRVQHEKTARMRIHRDMVIRAIEMDKSRWREIVKDAPACVKTADDAIELIRRGPEWY
jgi:hypothetical protein